MSLTTQLLADAVKKGGLMDRTNEYTPSLNEYTPSPEWLGTRATLRSPEAAEYLRKVAEAVAICHQFAC